MAQASLSSVLVGIRAPSSQQILLAQFVLHTSCRMNFLKHEFNSMSALLKSIQRPLNIWECDSCPPPLSPLLQSYWTTVSSHTTPCSFKSLGLNALFPLVRNSPPHHPSLPCRPFSSVITQLSCSFFKAPPMGTLASLCRPLSQLSLLQRPKACGVIVFFFCSLSRLWVLESSNGVLF